LFNPKFAATDDAPPLPLSLFRRALYATAHVHKKEWTFEPFMVTFYFNADGIACFFASFPSFFEMSRLQKMRQHK
jgi:hypothetical protein